MVKKKVLITRPNHDSITHYLCEWSKEIIESASELMDVHDLPSKKANLKNLTSRLSKQKYDLIIFNGHGSPTQVAGYADEILIETNKNHNLLNGKIIYCLACSSAKKLGKICVKSGAKGFIGYSDEFALVRDSNMTSRPLDDKYAKSILVPTNQIPLALIKGKSLSEAVERSKNKYYEEITKLQNSESEPGASSLAMVLMCNLAVLTKYGNDDETI